jgi:hypothetical protein
MIDAKTIVLSVLALSAVIGLAVVILLRARGTARDTPGERLLAHWRDRNDYRIFVGMPVAEPTDWVEVVRVSDPSVTLADSGVVGLSAVTAYLVTYPSGTLVDYCAPSYLPLPAWVGGLRPAAVHEHDELTLADLQVGQSLVRVTFGQSTARPESPSHYSTTLTNVSNKRIRVLKFAGYSRMGKAFRLNTVSGQFYSASEFREWYAQRGDWIGPGESVTDSNNYGSPPVLWAYYCEAEGGQKFVTGRAIE